MRLQDRLPDSVTVGRRRYKVDLDFRNVLDMMDIMADKSLLEESRLYLALKCVMRHVPRKLTIQDAILQQLTVLCFPKDKRTEDEKPSMSLKQDADLIIGAFRQSYGINLFRPQYDVSGKRVHGNAAQDYIAGLKYSLGDDRKSSFKVVTPAETIICDCTIADIVDFGGATTDNEPFSCTIYVNGLPTVTPNT